MHKSAATPHYPVLTSLAVGLDSKNIFEFGCGGSTIAIVDAVQHLGCNVYTVDIRPLERTNSTCGDIRYPLWRFLRMRSEEALLEVNGITFDFVFHDGAHDYDTVKRDLQLIIPQVRRHGMLAIHDTFQEGVSAAVYESLVGVAHTRITLPYACGLTLVRIESQ